MTPRWYKDARFIVVLVHTTLVVGCHLANVNRSSDAMVRDVGDILAVLLIVLDFPAMVACFLCLALSIPAGDRVGAPTEAALLIVFGGLQWFLLTQRAVMFYRRGYRRKAKPPKNGPAPPLSHCSNCGCDLPGNASELCPVCGEAVLTRRRLIRADDVVLAGLIFAGSFVVLTRIAREGFQMDRVVWSTTTSLPLHVLRAMPVLLSGCAGTLFFWWRIRRRRVSLENRQATPPLCRTCGYNLTGNVSGVCPECGTKVEQP